MPKKPDMFGIKFWLLVDLETKYVCQGFPYLGAEGFRPRDDLLGKILCKKSYTSLT